MDGHKDDMRRRRRWPSNCLLRTETFPLWKAFLDQRTRRATAELGRQSCAIFSKRDCCVAFRILAGRCSTSLLMKMSRWRIHDSNPRIIKPSYWNALLSGFYDVFTGLICETCNKTIKHWPVRQPRSVVVLEETSHNKALFCFQKCVRHLPREFEFIIGDILSEPAKRSTTKKTSPRGVRWLPTNQQLASMPRMVKAINGGTVERAGDNGAAKRQ